MLKEKRETDRSTFKVRMQSELMPALKMKYGITPKWFRIDSMENLKIVQNRLNGKLMERETGQTAAESLP